MKDIEEVEAVCNTSFSDPPDEEIMPFEYFKQMCKDEVIENFVEQSNLYCVQKTGRPLNTNKNEMEQLLGIHIIEGIVNMPIYKIWSNCRCNVQESVWHHEKLFSHKR